MSNEIWENGRYGEIICQHGVGHPRPGFNKVHGCDGCCRLESFKTALEELPLGERPEVRFDFLGLLSVTEEQ